jgi:hypothetical protein
MKSIFIFFLMAFLTTAGPVKVDVKKDKAKGKSKVLILSQEQEDFTKLSEYLTNEIHEGFDTKSVILPKATKYKDFEKTVNENTPDVLVVMDNQGVTLAKEYYSKNPKKKFPSVALMGLNFKSVLKNDPHLCGIAYEVPVFSMLTQFRLAKGDRKLNKVLTFYRGSQFGDVIKEAQELVKMENIELVAVDVETSKKPLLDYFKYDGRKLIESGQFDAVYVALDSVLLEKSIFLNFWLPAAKDTDVPFLIGADKFVNPSFDFAVFGMSPNLREMASQAAQMIESLASGDKCQRIEDLIGVNKFINEKKSKTLGVEIDENSRSEIKFLK